jgi:hypothetical protein
LKEIAELEKSVENRQKLNEELQLESSKVRSSIITWDSNAPELRDYKSMIKSYLQYEYGTMDLVCWYHHWAICSKYEGILKDYHDDVKVLAASMTLPPSKDDELVEDKTRRHGYCEELEILLQDDPDVAEEKGGSSDGD